MDSSPPAGKASAKIQLLFSRCHFHSSAPLQHCLYNPSAVVHNYQQEPSARAAAFAPFVVAERCVSSNRAQKKYLSAIKVDRENPSGEGFYFHFSAKAFVSSSLQVIYFGLLSSPFCFY